MKNVPDIREYPPLPRSRCLKDKLSKIEIYDDIKGVNYPWLLIIQILVSIFAICLWIVK